MDAFKEKNDTFYPTNPSDPKTSSMHKIKKEIPVNMIERLGKIHFKDVLRNLALVQAKN